MNETAPTQDTAPAPQPAPQAQGEGRFSLADDGQIFLQRDTTNPLAGEAVGRIVKGPSMLEPVTDYAGAREWLAIHVRSVLEPLFMLKQEEGEGALQGAARDIGNRLFDHLGVVHRSDLEEMIAALEGDMRKHLRTKGVRLGPVLVFLPALVKPAAVRMRAMLWALWNDKGLPVARPADGRVSEVVDGAAVDRHFYRMIGYPVFGPRAIRIDMLDRVVTDIYDTADKGVFEAKHKYAEWLGCNLEDLHAILESMGHRKLKTEAPAEAAAPEEAPAAETPAAETPPHDTPVVEAGTVEVSEAVADIVAAPKAPPVVAKFMLKRGKMSERPGQNRRPQGKRNDRHEEKREGEKPGFKDKPRQAFDPNKPQGRRDRDKGGDRDERPRKPKFDRDRDRDREARVYTFETKKDGGDDDGNPFAILKNLKK